MTFNDFITSVIPILLMCVSVITAHFMGIEKAISSSKKYTDETIELFEKNIDSFIINTSSRFDKIDKQFDKIDERFTRLSEKIDSAFMTHLSK